MTDVEKFETTGDPAVEEVGNPEQQTVDVNEMQIAYLVGLQPDGNFFFQVFGQKQGLVELMGLHQHVTHRLTMLQDQKVGAGDMLTVESLKQLQVLNQKLDALLNVVAPKPPENDL